MKKIFFLIIGFIICFSLNAQSPVPYLQSPTSTSIWASWRTEESLESKVLYGESEKNLDHIVTGESWIFTDPEDNYTKNYFYHGVQLTDLKPDTRYFYKVVSGDLSSDIYSFRTQPPEGSHGIFRILILGDHQEFDDRYEKLVAAAKTVSENKFGTPIENHINLLTNVGDQVDSSKLRQWEEIHFRQSEALSPNIPITTLIGNHELLGTLGEEGYSAHFFYQGLEYKGIKGKVNRYYPLQIGRILFLMLDSEHAHAEQREWVNRIMEIAQDDPDIDWILKYSHREINVDVASPKTTMCVEGHTHFYGRQQLIDVPTYRMISGGAAYSLSEGDAPDFVDIFQISALYWNFQIVEFNSYIGAMNVESYVIGNEWEEVTPPLLIDSFTRKFDQNPPHKPSGYYRENLSGSSWTFISSPYSTDSEFDYNSVWFQISSFEDFSGIDYELIRDRGKIYMKSPMTVIDYHENVNIFRLTLSKDELPDIHSQYARVRHRDQNLEWSEWSDFLSLDISNEDFSIEIYPNPTHGELWIKNLPETSAEIALYDIMGRKLYQEKIRSSSLFFDMGNYSAGVYFLRINQSVVKIIKY